MSVDIEMHGVPERVTVADIATMLVQWCGSEIATLELTPVLHVALRGASQMGAEWNRGPRAVEVYRAAPRVVWLTLRHADDYTYAVARSFAVWWLRGYGRKGATARMSTTGGGSAVKLLAYAADERWAYVQEGDRCLLLRPPYQEDLAVSDADVERAVTVHGYTASDRAFATRQELLDFLRDESVRAWREHNPPVDLATLRERCKTRGVR